ncbi:MAG: flagellar basal body L-ring protein FlgH [Bdellovibrionaceae bacterium]|nr:flagellar basal body L-ring protein FlgH [Pseudobdellovibrionaceae bacterium]
MKDSLRLAVFVIALAIVASMTSGCASFGKKFKAFLNGRSVEETEQANAPRVSTPRFSETDSVRYGVERKYRRMSRDRFEEEAEVAADAGSLWVMEGQGAYLFAQNRTRLVGDLLSVRVEGAPKTQLQTKTRVIAKLLERLEKPEPGFLRGPASTPQTASAGAQAPNSQGQPQAQSSQQQQQQAGQAPANAQAQAAGAQAGAAPGQAPAQAPKPETNFNVQSVPTRIVEVLRDGSYRVKGSQEFMIGKREYRVIVTGIVRPEDFNDEGLDAEKLLDSQFDIVSAKRGASL